MLTFFAITTVINLALGYGLAIYLIRSRPCQPDIGRSEQSPVDITETPSLTPPVNSEVTAVLPSAPPATSSEPEPPAAELPELVSPMQSIQPQPENPKSEVHNREPIAEQLPAADSAATTTVDASSDTQPPSEEDLLAGIAAFRAQLSAENPPAESDGDNDVNADTPTTEVPA